VRRPFIVESAYAIANGGDEVHVRLLDWLGGHGVSDICRGGPALSSVDPSCGLPVVEEDGANEALHLAHVGHID
jgi:hypothetical protein